MCLIELLSHLTMIKLTAMSDQKPPFIFNNYPLHLFTLTAASPLINLCSMQKYQKQSRVTTFIVFMFFSACPHLHACLHFPWFYMTAGLKIRDHLQYRLAQDSHIFSYQKIYLARGAYALTLALRGVAIFTTAEQTRFFDLGIASSLREEKLWIQTC